MTKTKQQLVDTSDRAPEEEKKPLCAWALVELFGHQRIVGKLTEQAFGSAVMFRVDVPDLLKNGEVARAGFTRYFGVSAIYGITPVTEDVVRKLLPTIDGTPSRTLAYHFVELAWHEQMAIAKSFGLPEEGDQGLEEELLFRKLFRRATESGKLADLWTAVESKHQKGRPDENPFRQS